MWSANSVPSTTTLSKPVPPSTETGALMLYWTWSSPPPVADVGLGRGREAARQSRHGDLVRDVAPDDLARRVVHVEGARAVAGRLGEREGADDEQVVAVVALEPQRRLVRVDDERVVAGAARDEQRLAGAGAQPAARRRDGREQVVGRSAPPLVLPLVFATGPVYVSESRFRPKIWPIWKVSLPAPPSSVVIALLSSAAKTSLPPRP